MYYFQDIVASLSAFWAKHGCVIVTPYDLEKGAGTSNPETLLRVLGPEPFSAAYIEPCRRPKDGRYGMNPNRLQHYFQYQVILKPSPENIVDLYITSLEEIGLDTKRHDIRFVHDDWENPTLGAWGLGWEVWIDGMEDTQFTFFQAAAGIPLHPITGEITYGIERLAMCLQGVHSIFDIKWNETLTYGDIFHQNEVQWSEYNFEKQDDSMWMRHFEDYQREAKRLVSLRLPIPAYDFVLKASHAFNMLDAKGVISVSERAGYIAKIRDLTKTVAEAYLTFREKLGFPLLKSTETIQVPQKLPLPSEIQKPSERFVLEIGVEELPSSFVPIGIEGIRRAMTTFLEKEGLSFSSIQSYGSPRRLAVVVNDLASHTAAVRTEKRGPSVQTVWDQQGNVTQAGQGFFKSVHLSPCSKEEISSKSIPGLEIREIKNEPYLFATVEHPAQSTATILQEKLPALIRSLEFPKMMRWADHELHFARPIRWILSVFGNIAVPFTLEYITADRTTFGHRQRKPGPITLAEAKDYEETLKAAFVLVDQKERESAIRSTVRKYESEFSLRAIAVERMVSELIYLSEWPEASTATFSEDLLDAPKEILSSEMIEHQKYIPLIDSKGLLSNRFVFVADNTPSELVKAGNVKVLTARLSDGSFLWKEDRKMPLIGMREKLRTVTYQKSLGTLWDKTDRVERFVSLLSNHIPSANLFEAQMAARLSKADLVSHVVGEFPHLQGLIGAYLAKDQGFSQEAATAIEEQYLPNQEDGELPKTPCGALLAIADKLDTLAGFFGISLKPTSSNDPYALRRQAIGVVRIILNEKLHLSLSTAIEQALSVYGNKKFLEEPYQIISDLQSYVSNRAKAIFSEMGFAKEAIEAITATQSDDIYDALLRLTALRTAQQSDHFASFLEVLKRCLGQAEAVSDTHVEESLLVETSEKALFQGILSAEKLCGKASQISDWNGYISALLELRRGIATLFDQVRVLSDDAALKRNRLALLARIINLASIFANPKQLVETVHACK